MQNKNSLLKITLALGLIVLFVGAGFTPDISGNIGKFSSSSNVKDKNMLRESLAIASEENIIKSSLQNRGYTFYVGGTGPGNYTSIQDAIDDAVSGDSIFVYNGTYYENIIVNKSVYLIGEDSSITIIDGTYSDNTIKITADVVNIDGFTIRNGSNSGIEIWGSIWTPSNNNVISNCIIYNSYYGILAEYSSHNNSITDCEVYDNDFGIYFYSSKFNNVTDCFVYNNSGVGVKIYGQLSTNNSIINCVVYNNDAGFDIFDHSCNDVFGCLIFDNNWGIMLRNWVSNNRIYWNTIANNSYGVYIIDSNDNAIFNNNFMNNTIDAYDEGVNSWDNGYPMGGNHWGNYTTPDEYHGIDQNESDFDLIVDDSYTVSGSGNQDRWPYVLPYGWLKPLFVTNILLVQFNQSASNTTINNTISDYGTEKLEYLELVDIYILAINISNQSEFDTFYLFENDTNVNFASLDMYTYSREAKPRHLTKPNDQCYPKQWHLNNYGVNPGVPTGVIDADIDAPQAWEHITDCRKDFNNENFTIAIIDSGVDLNHPDIKNNLWVNPGEINGTTGADDDGNGIVDDIHGAEFNVEVDYFDGKPVDVSYYKDGTPDDESGHGTHCAGIICAEGNNEIGVTGVCWRAQLMVLAHSGPLVTVMYKDIVGVVPSRLLKASKKAPLEKIKDADSSEKPKKYTFNSYVSAIDYILKQKQNGVNVKVVSYSNGISRDNIIKKNVRPRDLVAVVPSNINAVLAEKIIRKNGYKETYENTIGKLNEAGILFVCAAGNDGRNIDISDAAGSYSNYPPKINLPNIISVAASDNQDRLTSFSDFGTTSVDITAPGENIMSLAMHGRYVYRDNNMDNKVSPQERRLSGEIRAIYPAGSIVEDDDGDLWDELFNFAINEKHDGTDTVYDVGENIYRDKDSSNNVSIGDERLTHVYIDGSLRYHKNSQVVVNDSDIGTPLYSFTSSEKHVEILPINNRYDFLESIYKENIVNDKVSAGDLRLTDVIITTHEKYSQVHSGDSDVGDCLHSFASNEKYCDKIRNCRYDPGEWIYIDNDNNDKVSIGDQRIGGKYHGTYVERNDVDIGRWLSDFEYDEKYSLVQHRSGTSMACPVVTGEVVHFWCQFPDLTHLEVKDWILKKVDPRQTLQNTVVSESGINNDGRVRMISGFDYGDAPDPYHGVFGQYPTILRQQNASHGASHEDMGEEWLGTDTSPEYDANVNTDPPYDVDNSSNLLPSRIPPDPHPPYESTDAADLDAYDDGVSLPLVVYAGGIYPIVFEINTEDPFINDVDQGRYDEYRSPKRDEKKIYINAYFDWNDDGDWDDGGEHLIKCPAKQCTWWGGPNMVCCYGVNWPPPNKNAFRMTTFPVPGDVLGLIWVRVRLDYGENVGRAPWPRYDSTHPFLTVGENLTDTYSHAQFGEVEDYFIISMKKEKIIGEPKYDDGDILWVTSETPIELVDFPENYGYLVNNYYRTWYEGDWSDWIEYVDGEPFYLEGEGEHQIEFYGSAMETRMTFSEDFEDGYDRWTTYDLDGLGYTWEWTDVVPWWADAATEGHFMLLDDNSMGELSNTDSLVSQPISCEIYNNTMLTFNGEFITVGLEKLWVNISNDYGETWNNVLLLTQDESGSGPWTADLRDIADGNVILVNFTYCDANEIGYGALIKDVAISGELITYSPTYYNYHRVDNSPPLTPELISPDPGEITTPTPTFDWTDVEDPTGVNYTLQIATDIAFMDLVLEKTNLTSSEYSVPEVEALLEGEYYWRVKAVDGLKHSSDWSEGYSFFVLEGFYINLDDFPMYEAESDPGYNEMCGPAVAQMTLNYIWWNSSNHSTPPMLFDDQPWLYERGLENNTNQTIPYLDTRGLWHIIQYNKPMPYSTFGYNFMKYSNVELDEMLKRICLWINYTIGTVGGYKPGHPLHVPAVVPAYGDYTNWMAIRGFHANRTAHPMPDEIMVYGFWVNDPYPASMGGLGENSYKTLSTWVNNYYQPLETDDIYDGKYVAIFEPPEITNEVDLTIATSPPRFTLEQQQAIQRIRLGKEEVSQDLLSRLNQWIIQAAIEGVTEQLIPYDDDFAAAFEKTIPGKPIFVRNMDGDDYYAVPFNMLLINSKFQLNWRKAIDLRYETVVVILIDADDGSFKETSWVKDPVKYLPVSRERARRIVLKELEGLGIEVEDDDMSIDLVYRNSSPFYPEWRIIINELGLTFFVSQNGSISY